MPLFSLEDGGIFVFCVFLEHKMSKLKNIREKLNLTQEELAEKSGVSARTIQRIEAGVEPKGHTLKVLAAALSVEAVELLKEKEKEKEEEKDTNDVSEPALDIALIKLINFSSLPFTFVPLVSIALPLLLMFISKQFNPLTKQIVTIQIIWTICAVIVFMSSAIFGKQFMVGNNYMIIVMALIILSNVIIILVNAASLTKENKLRIALNFSFL